MIHFRALVAAALIASCPLTAAIGASQKLVNSCLQLDDPDLGISACTRLLNDPVFAKIKNNVSLLHGDRASAYFNKGDYDRALLDLDEALRDDPRNFLALNTRGNVYWRRGAYQRAILDFNEVIRLKPNFAMAYANRGSARADLGQLEDALADLTESIRLAPRVAETFNNRGVLWRNKGEYDKAIADYNEAIRLDPKHKRAYANRGEAWRFKGDLDRALADQDQQIRLYPDGVLGYLYRGDTYRYKDDFDLAMADYSRVLKIEPDSIAPFVGRGLTYEKMGDVAKAKAEFDAALASNSQNRSGINEKALETAKAHLAAFSSGVAPPVIPAAPSRVASATAIPTPVAAVTASPSKPAPSQGRRVALVIGNSAYQNVPALANPQKDANAIAASLQNIGFEVVKSTDATREKMVDALRNFANEAEKSDWAVVYYAGHGMEVGGVNYLVPVDAKLAVDRDIQYEAVPLSQVLNAAETAKKIKLVMLDACRDNPFTPRKTAAPEVVAASMSTAGAPITTRSSNGRGLAEVKVTGATLVVYAAKDGQVALDGEGGNSPFAVAVTQRVATPGVEINKIFRLVRDDVMEATAGRQEPYTYGSLPGKEDFFFVAK
jgi:tetratricopeptide (TPR) repeat protein